MKDSVEELMHTVTGGGFVDYAAFGKRVRFIRRCLDITQEQLAEKIGLTAAFIGHIERGTRIPSIETLYRLCLALGVSADYLMGL